MGIIISEVKNIYLSAHADQANMLKPFLNGFDITYAEEKQLNNTIIFAFLLKPEQFIREAFGIDKEILLAYSKYEILQPRALQAVDMLFDIFPFKNRVDTLNCFFISKDKAVAENAGVTSFTDNRSRSIVPFVYDDLIANQNDSWYVRNVLRKTFMMSICLAILSRYGTRPPFLVDSRWFPAILTPSSEVKTGVFLVCGKLERRRCCLKLIG